MSQFIGEPYWIDPTGLKFDAKFSKFNEPKSAVKYDALKRQIEQDGQNTPILVRGGLIGDGVHRCKVARELGRHVLAIEVKEDMPDKEYIRLCNRDTMVGRNHSATVQAIMAYKMTVEFEYSDAEARADIGLKDRRAIGYVRTISASKYDRIYNILDTLAKGDAVTIGEYAPTRSIEVAKRNVAKIEEAELLGDDPLNNEELAISYSDLIKTETATDQFWQMQGYITDHATKLKIIQLLNVVYNIDK